MRKAINLLKYSSYKLTPVSGYPTNYYIFTSLHALWAASFCHWSKTHRRESFLRSALTFSFCSRDELLRAGDRTQTPKPGFPSPPHYLLPSAVFSPFSCKMPPSFLRGCEGWSGGVRIASQDGSITHNNNPEFLLHVEHLPCLFSWRSEKESWWRNPFYLLPRFHPASQAKAMLLTWGPTAAYIHYGGHRTYCSRSSILHFVNSQRIIEPGCFPAWDIQAKKVKQQALKNQRIFY